MLLTEKYRPKQLSELVFIDDSFKNKFESWIANKNIDSHLLFYGPPGTGKSSSINVLINELQIKDLIRNNMSDKTSVDDMRKIIDFASVPPMHSEFKLIVLEEFERASPQAQDSLKYVMEQYSNWCRFIITTNNVAKVSEPIRSRCQMYHFNKLNFVEFVTRIVTILSGENISFQDTSVIESYVRTYFPDLRACINAIAQNTIDGVLQTLNSGESYSIDKFTSILTSFQKTDLLSLKKMIVEYIPMEEIPCFYQFMYNHLEMITGNQNEWDEILLKIADYLYKHETVAYPDINLVACLIEIKSLLRVY